MVEDGRSMINRERLAAEMDRAGLDVIVAASPENTFYLSSCFIRTQISIRDRLALVVWPRQGEPTYIVCNIEESLARSESWVQDIRTYVEFEESPVKKLLKVLRERGLTGARIGVEERFLTTDYYNEITENSLIDFKQADGALEVTRAIKTPGEIARITEAFRLTEDAIREAWTASHASDSERQIADRMIEGVARRGADNVRHISLNSAENTAISHRYPGNRRVQPGDLIGTDFGANWHGYNSDMARMGIVDRPSDQIADEYRRYREAYIEALHFLKAGVTAADVFNFCSKALTDVGLHVSGPHVGHSLSRQGGHDNPIFHPRNQQVLEPNMLIALEPVCLLTGPDRKYHLEDLILITENGNEILTDWQSTASMIRIPG